MSKKSDDFLDWLLSKKINQYRLEMLTDFTSAPQLLLGDGLRSFEVLTLFFPTLQIGPQGLPVPGGTFSDVSNALKYPARTRYSRDILDSMDTRNISLDSSTAEGTEVIPDAQGENWKHLETNLVLAGGAVAATNIAPAATGFNTEVMINHINVKPVPSVDLVQLVVAYTASTSNLIGQIQDTIINYKFDPANSIIGGDFHIVFPQGKRLVSNAQVTNVRADVSGGIDVEELSIGCSYRHVVSIP